MRRATWRSTYPIRNASAARDQTHVGSSSPRRTAAATTDPYMNTAGTTGGSTRQLKALNDYLRAMQRAVDSADGAG